MRKKDIKKRMEIELKKLRESNDALDAAVGNYLDCLCDDIMVSHLIYRMQTLSKIENFKKVIKEESDDENN